MVKFERVTDSEWDAIPTPQKASKPNEYDDAIAAIIDGQIIGIPVADEKEVKGKRIAIARRANSSQNVRLQFRYDATRKLLFARLSDKPASEPRDENTPPRPRGRPKKTA